MPRRQPPPTAVAVSFVDCINRHDLDGLAALMTEDHTLVVMDEPPLVGRAANVDAWRGYFTAYPDYVVSPRSITASGTTVAILGTTTGSHLGLPDDEETKLTVVWVAETSGGKLLSWRVAEDTPTVRERFAIASAV